MSPAAWPAINHVASLASRRAHMSLPTSTGTAPNRNLPVCTTSTGGGLGVAPNPAASNCADPGRGDPAAAAAATAAAMPARTPAAPYPWLTISRLADSTSSVKHSVPINGVVYAGRPPLPLSCASRCNVPLGVQGGSAWGLRAAGRRAWVRVSRADAARKLGNGSVHNEDTVRVSRATDCRTPGSANGWPAGRVKYTELPGRALALSRTLCTPALYASRSNTPRMPGGANVCSAILVYRSRFSRSPPNGNTHGTWVVTMSMCSPSRPRPTFNSALVRVARNRFSTCADGWSRGTLSNKRSTTPSPFVTSGPSAPSQPLDVYILKANSKDYGPEEMSCGGQYDYT